MWVRVTGPMVLVLWQGRSFLAELCILAESEFESDGFFAEPCSGSSVAESELGVRRLFGRAL